jgi:hypothetical protein
MKTITQILMAATSVLFACGTFAQNVANFENLSLPPESYWNGSDASGMFSSGGFTFYNSYDATYGSWSGWAYSNQTDTETYSWENQFSAASVPTYPTEGNYAVSYIVADWLNDYSPVPSIIRVDNDINTSIHGAWICLNTLASLYMENDGSYDGAYAENRHYLKLIVRGYLPFALTFTEMEVYLADYRFENTNLHYKANQWQYVSFIPLGEVSELQFILESSDDGEYGLNTPAYFCIDNFNESYSLSNLPELFAEAPQNIYINSGESVDITVLAGGGIQPFTYQWEANASLSSTVNQTVTANPLETTTYYVTVSDQNFSEETFEIIVHVNSVHANQEIAQSINVYPMPVQSTLHIDNVSIGSFAIELQDTQGKSVYYQDQQTGNTCIDMNGLQSGVYVLCVSGEQGNYTQKIIKL